MITQSTIFLVDSAEGYMKDLVHSLGKFRQAGTMQEVGEKIKDDML